MNQRFIAGASLALALMASSHCYAQKAGDTIGGLGLAYISPNSSLSSPAGSNPAYAAFFSPNPPTATVSAASTLAANVMHMYSDNWAGELSFGLPPRMQLNFDIPAAPAIGQPVHYGNAAAADALTPSVLADYLFKHSNDAIRPYVGFGVEYATFNNISVDTSKLILNALANTSVSMSSGFFPVYKAGVIYNLDDKWSVNASLAYIPLTTKLTFTGTGLGAGSSTTTATLNVNPVDFVVRIGYKF